MLKLNQLAASAPLVLFGALAWSFGSVPAIQPANSTELAEVAVGYIKAEKVGIAKDFLNQALSEDAKNARAHYVAGMLALQEKDWKRTIGHLEATLGTDPGDLDAALSLAVAYQRIGDYKASLEQYGKLRKAQPKNPKVAYNLGMLEIELLHFTKANDYLNEYLMLDPNAPDKSEVRATLAQIEKRLRRPSN